MLHCSVTSSHSSSVVPLQQGVGGGEGLLDPAGAARLRWRRHTGQASVPQPVWQRRSGRQASGIQPVWRRQQNPRQAAQHITQRHAVDLGAGIVTRAFCVAAEHSCSRKGRSQYERGQQAAGTRLHLSLPPQHIYPTEHRCTVLTGAVKRALQAAAGQGQAAAAGRGRGTRAQHALGWMSAAHWIECSAHGWCRRDRNRTLLFSFSHPRAKCRSHFWIDV